MEITTNAFNVDIIITIIVIVIIQLISAIMQDCSMAGTRGKPAPTFSKRKMHSPLLYYKQEDSVVPLSRKNTNFK